MIDTPQNLAPIACQWSSSMLVLAQSTFDGKWVFVGALVLVLIWLIVMPKRFAGHEHETPPWWRNVRIWAIVVCVIQIAIYWRFG